MYKKSIFIVVGLFIFQANYCMGNDNINNSLFNKIQSNIEFSGFGDIIMLTETSDENQHFNLGQLEFGMVSQITNKTSFSLAIAYDKENFSLGSFEINYEFINSDDDLKINQLTFGAGAFDVPFGIDWNVYPSIDRRLVSVPLVNIYTHDSWNDYGINFRLESKYISIVVFAVNGFLQEYDDISGTSYELDAEIAYGSRLGIIRNNFELGTSFVIIDELQRHEMHLWGLDIQYYSDFLEFKGEYIQHYLSPPNLDSYKNYGYYFQSIFKFERYFTLGRLDIFSFSNDVDETARFCLGAGYILDEGFQIRFESQINIENTNNTNMLQIVAGF